MGIEQRLTSISLSNGPTWEHRLQILCCFFAQWRCSGKDTLDRREVILLYHISRFGHCDDNWRHKIKTSDLVLLDRFKEALELELRQNDDTIATIDSQMCDDYQSIYMVER